MGSLKMGSLKMSELSITSVGAPKFESTQRSTPKTPSVTLFDLKKVPSKLSNHMIGQVHDHIGLIEKAQRLKQITTEKLNNIGNKYEEINKQITIEIRRLKAETEADDLKIATLDREKERIEIESSALKKDIRRLESKLGETDEVELRCSSSQLENDQTNDEIANAKNIISDNSHLKKERFEEEIALKDRNDVIYMALKE